MTGSEESTAFKSKTGLKALFLALFAFCMAAASIEAMEQIWHEAQSVLSPNMMCWTDITGMNSRS